MSLLSPHFWASKNHLQLSQILWINLIMDTLAALPLVKSTTLDRYMNEKPVAKKANILTAYMRICYRCSQRLHYLYV